MYPLVVGLHVLVSIVIIISVLFQAGKGAAIGSSFGGASSQTVFGSTGPATLLGKVTTLCAVIFMCTSLYLTYQVAKGESSVMDTVPAVKSMPAVPSEGQVPATEMIVETPAENPAE